MNFLKLSCLFVVVLMINSCKDEVVSCTPMDWEGTYMGTQDCQEQDTTQDVSITFTVHGFNTVNIKLEYPTYIIEYDEVTVTFDDCKLNHFHFLGPPGFTDQVNGTLDGDQLTLEIESSTESFQGPTLCTIMATRQ